MLHDHPTARIVIYIVAVISQIAAFFAPVAFPGADGLQDAFQQTANLLGIGAIGTALTNVPSRPPVGR